MTERTRRGRWLKGFVQKRVPLMITCRELEGFILDYLDGALPWWQRVVFRLHIALCRECRDYVSAFQRTIDAGKSAFERADDEVASDVPDALVRAVLAARRASEDRG